jgi:hypothetical protein
LTSSLNVKSLKNVHLEDDFNSFEHLKKAVVLNSPMAGVLKQLMSCDVYHRKWKFDGDSIIDDFWTLDASATATGFNIPVPAEFPGLISAATGTTDNGAVSMKGPAIFKGDKLPLLHVHFETSAITSFQMEVGWVDALTSTLAPAVSDVDTPATANGCGDCAVLHMDTDQTLATLALVGDSSLTTLCTSDPIGVLTPTASTRMCVKVGVDHDDIFCVIDGKRSQRGQLPNAIEGATALFPWIFFRSRAGSASRTVKVSLVEIIGELD